ncbi:MULTISPECIES: DUF2213 domain-containing protein [unclassified Aurantimonas]|uniref:DUF2213 domain-containing protein n=1 Tax=unclassified Aurantimonas TaxID=2638230 RepID=UPI002E182E58|nr:MULTISPECIES: DUF2213 domain-containing protein [unclassified Aurantimonas]MEC5289394.1 DUF2213 domain-containing protein [Aurantimonas sp. C2-3-R2]MEC5410474.1 DUF2213 domain-containing protein [Aurantimonas sp. C2-4-R8]
MQFIDAVTVSGATRRTADGFLVATAKSVRVGIQHYAGHECGVADKATVRIYRSPEEVFSQDSLQSFSHSPVTIDHPSVPVTADNWKELAVGEVSTAAQMDGKWVSLPLILKDAKAIAALDSGKRQLSAGYVCQLDMTPGTTPEGEAYDGRQVGIKINHLALVDKARAGDEARIGDSADDAGNRTHWGVSPLITTDAEQEGLMANELRTVMVDGLSVSTTDAGAQAIEKLTKDKDAIAAKLSDAETKHADAIKAKDAEIAKKDAELDDAKGKILSDADLDKKVQDRGDLVALAGAIAKDVKTTGISDAEIRKAVVVAKLGDAAVDGKPAAYIDARFDILGEDAKKGNDPVAAALADGRPAHMNDGWSDSVFASAGVKMKKEA